MKLLEIIKRYWILFLIALMWELQSVFLNSNKFPELFNLFISFFSTFIYDSIIESSGGGENGYSYHVYYSFINFFSGFLIGSIIGFLLSILILPFKVLNKYIYSSIDIIRMIPPLVFIPIIFIALSFTNSSSIVTVSIYSFFSIFVYTYSYIAYITVDYNKFLKIYHLNYLQTIKHIIIPSVLSYLKGPLRVTGSISIGILIVVEFMGSPYGIGRVLRFSMNHSSVELIIIGILWSIILLLIFEIVLNLLFSLVHKYKF